MSRAKRYLFLAAGCLSLLLGLVGIVTPLLPTTPFVLLAAFCFSKSSQRFHAWLTNHSLFRETIQSWQQNHTIPRKAKALALGTLAVSALVISLNSHIPELTKLIALAFSGGLAIFILIF